MRLIKGEWYIAECLYPFKVCCYVIQYKETTGSGNYKASKYFLLGHPGRIRFMGTFDKIICKAKDSDFKKIK